MSTMFVPNSMQEAVEILSKDLAEQTNKILLNQLGDLVDKKILVWERGVNVITMDERTNKLTMSQAGRLVLKDKEYISKLESKLAAATDALTLIAAPRRADGTYNRDRASCEELAKQTLDKLSG